MRAAVSIPLPAATGTIIVMGRDGKLCAHASSRPNMPQPAPTIAERSARRVSIIPSEKFKISMWRIYRPRCPPLQIMTHFSIAV